MQGLQEALEASDVRVQIAAVRALGQIGAKATPVIPQLCKKLSHSDPNLREMTIQTLGQIGSSAVSALPFLKKFLGAEQAPAIKAIHALQKIGPPAVPVLLEALRSPHPHVHFHARTALGHLGTIAVPGLFLMLKDKEANIRERALDTLWLISQHTPIPVKPLLPSLHESNKSLRFIAFRILSTSRPSDLEIAIPGLVDNLKHSNRWLHAPAANVLVRIGAKAVPHLRAALTAPRPTSRLFAAIALGQLHIKDPNAIQVIHQMAYDRDYHMRQKAVKSLKLFRPLTQASLDLLIAKLGDGKGSVRGLAEKLLAQLGPSLLPTLLKALHHTSPKVRAHAAQAIGRMGAKAKHLLPTFAKELQNPKSKIQGHIAHALGGIGDAQAIPLLLPLLQHGQELVRMRAALALGKIKQHSSAQGIEALQKSLSDSSLLVRKAAATALGHIGTAAASCIPTLLQMLRDQKVQPRQDILKTLAHLGPKGQSALLDLTTSALLQTTERKLALQQLMPSIATLPQHLSKLLQAYALDAEDREIQALALKLMAHITSQRGDTAIQSAMDAFKTRRDIPSQTLLLRYFATLGARAQIALPLLAQLLQQTPPTHCKPAARALRAIGPQATTALLPLLQHAKIQTRICAMLALHQVGPQATSIAKQLIKQLSHSDEEVRYTAALALGNLSPPAQEAVPAMLRALRTQDWHLQSQAALTLGHLLHAH